MAYQQSFRVLLYHFVGSLLNERKHIVMKFSTAKYKLSMSISNIEHM